jgi:DEAD/DEAH box helicase domain-containing protein
MRNIVFDIESKRTVEEVKGWVNKHKMGIAVLCAIDYDTREQYVFSHDYPGALDLDKIHGMFVGNNLIGYNIKSFDMRVLQEEFMKYGQDAEAPFGVFDLSDGKRISLGSLSKATFGDSKLMNGADAPLEWRKGTEARKAVVEYCTDDVKKTINLLNYGIEHGRVYYNDANGVKREWVVDWKRRLNDLKPSVLYPECIGKYRVEKKAWQCGRCTFKRTCRIRKEKSDDESKVVS